MTSVCKLQCLAHRQHPLQMSWQQVRMLWCVCTMGKLGRDSTHYGAIVFVRRWQLALLMFSHKAYHLHQHQQNIIVSECTTKCSSTVNKKKGTVNNLLPQDWGWKESDGLLFPVQTDLPPAPQCSCKTDCSNLRCTCKKHNIECSVVCSNCKGSGCANSFQETVCENSEFDDHENSDPVTFTNWTPGHTDNFVNHTVEDCVVVIPYKGGIWDDIPCGSQSFVGSDNGETHLAFCEYNIGASGGVLVGR
ncbi:hypothetical protein MAR_005743 [Mya arenaria]|uniref:Uncharacterized protein n=1 Tax=Mya arenaria TaxID=6604 RepID=A0ABY7F4K7_MYAAR|nr:hypothetical protein MAR_005743 [Mya arenaria]